MFASRARCTRQVQGHAPHVADEVQIVVGKRVQVRDISLRYHQRVEFRLGRSVAEGEQFLCLGVVPAGRFAVQDPAEHAGIGGVIIDHGGSNWRWLVIHAGRSGEIGDVVECVPEEGLEAGAVHGHRCGVYSFCVRVTIPKSRKSNVF